MLLVLAISHVDVRQAERLVRWIGFLSERSGQSMKREQMLLVPSEIVSNSNPFDRIREMVREIFGVFYVTVPLPHEVGWPGAANHMFLAAAEFAEYAEMPFLFLEPDGCPLTESWFSRIQEEYENAGLPFMGGYVPTPPPHMTGIGVYPADWRSYAPSLAKVPDRSGWDTYRPDEVNPHCHFTPLIQHVFKRHEPGWSIPGLNALDKRAVLFHQDKQGKLIRLLDEANYGGECSRHPLFSYAEMLEEPVMTKFYSTANATKAIVARNGARFVFDPVDSFGGSVPGVYVTESQQQQDLLDDLAQNPTSGVSQITQEEWEKLAKKNWIHPVLNTLKRSSEISTQQMPLPGRAVKVQAPILPTPSHGDAVVVAEPLSGAGDMSAPPGLASIKDIGEVLRMDTVQPSQPAPASAKAKPKKPGKKV